MVDDTLSDIKSILEDIKALTLLANQDKLDEVKQKLVKNGSVEEKVYNLCDGTNATTDIAEKTVKTNDYVNAVVSTLRQKGLVKTVRRDGKNIHLQVF